MSSQKRAVRVRPPLYGLDGLTLGERLRRARRRTGRTSQDVADSIGTRQEIMSRWEHDQCIPRLPVFARLAGEYSMPMDALFLGPLPEEAATLAVMCPVCGEPGCDGAHLTDGRPCPRCDLTMDARLTRVWVCTNPECAR